MWRIAHGKDYRSEALDFYLVSKALKYRVWKTGIQDTQILNTETNQGIKEWHEYVARWTNGQFMGFVR
jgi:hypothetical protein